MSLPLNELVVNQVEEEMKAWEGTPIMAVVFKLWAQIIFLTFAVLVNEEPLEYLVKISGIALNWMHKEYRD